MLEYLTIYIMVAAEPGGIRIPKAVGDALAAIPDAPQFDQNQTPELSEVQGMLAQLNDKIAVLNEFRFPGRKKLIERDKLEQAWLTAQEGADNLASAKKAYFVFKEGEEAYLKNELAVEQAAMEATTKQNWVDRVEPLFAAYYEKIFTYESISSLKEASDLSVKDQLATNSKLKEEMQTRATSTIFTIGLHSLSNEDVRV